MASVVLAVLLCKCRVEQYILTTLNCLLFLHHFWLFLRRRPTQACGVDGDRWPFVLRAVHQFVNDLWRNADHLLTFPVADEIQRLQCYDDVVRRNARHVTTIAEQ